MSTITPINGLPIPDDNSPNDPPIHFSALGTSLDTLLNSRFASTSARDAAIPVPVKNMECWVDGVGKQINSNGTTAGWVTVLDYTPTPRPFGYLQGTTTQSLADGNTDAMLLNNQLKLVNMDVDLALGKLKATIAGWYEVSGGVHFGGVTGGRRIAAIQKNGTTLLASQNTCYPSDASQVTLATATIPVLLNVNDYVQVNALQNSGSTISMDRTQCFLKMTWIGPQ